MKTATKPSTPATAVSSAAPTHRQQMATKWRALEDELNDSLLERQDAIRASLATVLSGQHIVILGTPGTGKSQLVTEIAGRIGDPGQGGLKTFQYLITRFTKDDELFGQISIKGLKEDLYVRKTEGRLPESELAFLDEVFKGSSAILNTLLTIMNERAFDNGGQRMRVPLMSLFGASNEMPQGEDLAALWDRFVVRLTVSDLQDDANMVRLLRSQADRLQRKAQGIADPPRTTMTRAELLEAQREVAMTAIPDSIAQQLTKFRSELKSKAGITASTRRWTQVLPVLQANAFLEGRMAVEEDDLGILQFCLWNQPEQQKVIQREAARLANPLNAKAVELLDKARSIYDDFQKSQQSSEALDKKFTAATESASKLKQVAQEFDKLYEQAGREGKSLTKIEQNRDRAKSWQKQIGEFILGQ